jgi:hypothetical protein
MNTIVISTITHSDIGVINPLSYLRGPTLYIYISINPIPLNVRYVRYLPNGEEVELSPTNLNDVVLPERSMKPQAWPSPFDHLR